MSKAEMLRAFVNQRLSLAAAEIFEQFERTIAEYEEELESRSKENQRQHELLDALSNPEVRSHTERLRHSTGVQQLLEDREEVLSEQQDWSSSLDQEDPEPRHIKEEQEELWTRQQGEQLRGLEEAENEFTSVPVKSEDADGEDWGGPEPQSPLQPEYSSEPETDERVDWEEMEEPQSGLNLLQNNEEPVSDVDFNTGGPSGISSECAGSFEHLEQLWKQTGVRTDMKPFSSSAQTGSVSTHMRVHAERRSFFCSVCEKSFSKSSNLVHHMRTHTGEKPFSCPYCSQTFAQKGQIKRHLPVHTGEKPFSCSFCSKRFSRKQNLQSHLTVHTGEKPFSCSLCSKSFADPSTLTQHLTSHTGEKPFSCSVCSKGFTRKQNLKRHLTAHTGETV